MQTVGSVVLATADLWGGRDLFEVWRLLLGAACTIYAIVLTSRSLWNWCVYLSGADRTKALMRSYLLVLFLRLQLRPFARELAQIGFWTVILLVVLYGHE